MSWYESLSMAEKIYFYIGIVGSVLLVIQIIMMLFSFGGDSDGDFGGEGDFDSPEGDLGISLFTIKGITSFLAIGGWVGLLVLQINQENIALSIIFAVLSGAVAMILVGLAMRALYKMQCAGNLVKDKLLGKEATVYVSVAPSRTGRGKITLTAQGAYTEMDAMTDDPLRIGVDEKVIISEIGPDYMVVKRKTQEEDSVNTEKKAE